MEKNAKKETQISLEVLLEKGFRQSTKNPNVLTYCGISLVLSAIGKWQICDEDGNVGNECVETIEELVIRIKESISK